MALSFTELDRKYLRPSLMIFCENEPVRGTGGNSNNWDLTGGVAGKKYIYLTDNNREDLSVSYERIEYKQRMINGTMRSYHVADKRTFATNWTSIPSRKVHVTEYSAQRQTVAAGQEMNDWYKTHTGSFWLLLVFDSDSTISQSNIKYNVEKVQVFFDNFSFNVLERGTDTDLWEVSMSLVEA